MSGEPPPPTGREALRAAMDNARELGRFPTSTSPGDVLPDECPVIPLGQSGETRYYLDAQKQMIPLTAGDHSRLRLLGLFCHQKEFIYSVPRWCRTNDKGKTTGWRPELVAEDFLAACGVAGLWDASEHERGRGSWCDEAGRLILHLGDQIVTFAPQPNPWPSRSIAAPGLVGRLVYPAAEPTPPPAERPTPGQSAGETMLATLETWRWRRADLDAVLMLGWIGAAMIGGALEWRPAVWLSGGKGTGKSTLNALLKGLFGAGLLSLADCTPASIWQTLKRQTLAVAVDELEADEDNRRQLQTVAIARVAASGGILARGSDKHQATKFTLRSCFLFSSVLIPPLAGPDRSRIAVLELHELDPSSPRPVLDDDRLRVAGQQLRRAMVDGWHRFGRTLNFYREALHEAGHSRRGEDQYGTLLACADLLLFSGETDKESAADWIARMQATEFSETADDVRDEDQCLMHLLSCPIDPYRKGERINLGEWINRAAGRVQGYDDPREAKKILTGYGMRLEATEAGEVALAVATNHSGMAGLFERTRWSSPRGVTGVWTQSLRRLDGAERGQKALYFGGATSRATLIPLARIPAPDDWREPASFPPPIAYPQ